MKTEFLSGLGITDQNVINQILAENGRDIERIKGERDALQTQLQTAQTTLKSFNAYLKSGSGVMGNKNDLLVGTLSEKPLYDTLITIFDDAEEKFFAGTIQKSGNIVVKGKGLTGERYLLINAIFCN